MRLLTHTSLLRSEKILSQIKDTVDVTEVIKPIYNFKAAEKSRKKGK